MSWTSSYLWRGVMADVAAHAQVLALDLPGFGGSDEPRRGGFGFAVNFARWATRRLTGVELSAPISGQRALRGAVLPVVVPFAPRFGMETGMNVDAVRAGFRLQEVELDLAHRATGKTLRGFVHRARQLVDFALVYRDRR